MMFMVKIKICGLTKSEEAVFLNRNRIDWAGMVMYFPKSKRCISLAQAKQIRAALNPEIKTVAVVVAPSLEQLDALDASGCFNFLQVHGFLPEQWQQHLKLPVLKAFNLTDLAQYAYFQHCPQIAGYVFDAAAPGSGKTFDWEVLKELPRDNRFRILAGGLNPANVAQAVAAVRPDVVDVSSGVEYKDKPGKDGALIDAFAARARGCCQEG
jgi:phosphoribosylanthranilate isomerase